MNPLGSPRDVQKISEIGCEKLKIFCFLSLKLYVWVLPRIGNMLSKNLTWLRSFTPQYGYRFLLLAARWRLPGPMYLHRDKSKYVLKCCNGSDRVKPIKSPSCP